MSGVATNEMKEMNELNHLPERGERKAIQREGRRYWQERGMGRVELQGTLNANSIKKMSLVKQYRQFSRQKKKTQNKNDFKNQEKLSLKL